MRHDVPAGLKEGSNAVRGLHEVLVEGETYWK
jgi:hypothetical protein